VHLRVRCPYRVPSLASSSSDDRDDFARASDDANDDEHERALAGYVVDCTYRLVISNLSAKMHEITRCLASRERESREATIFREISFP